jgi:hypothetical protein
MVSSGYHCRPPYIILSERRVKVKSVSVVVDVLLDAGPCQPADQNELDDDDHYENLH